uniref:Uncharacterized protein n=1 Tax=Lygus hesperus TaxID=30085 RepID=A0A0K8SKJ9_LYGHE
MALPAVAAVPTTASGKITAPLPVPGDVRVKEERPDDAEINAIAAKMLEQNKAKMAQAAAAAAAAPSGQQARVPGQQSMLGYLNKAGQGRGVTATSNGDDEKPPLDITSQKGKFGWVTLGGEHIPYIVRAGEKFCSVRMVEQKLLSKYLSYLSSDIFSCTCIRSYYITECEAKLFTDINMKHCEGMFGKEPFTDKDLVVLLGDANEFYQFLDLCYNKLLHPQSEVNHARCGFVRINKDSVVPYTVKDNCRYVPLFYFEGETDTLKKQSAHLGPWDLAYLKFCCKVQGIRSELFANDSCQVISLAEIRGFFPAGTVFDEYWPPKVVDNQLLVAKNSVRHNQTSWIKAPPTPTPTGVSRTPGLPDSAASPMAPAANALNNWMNRYPHTANAMANNNTRLAQQQANAARIQQQVQQMQQQHQNSVSTPQPHVVRPFNRNNIYYPTLNSGAHQNLQPQHNQPHGRANPTATSRYYSTSTEVIDLSSPPHSPQQQRTMMINGGQQPMANPAARSSQHVQHSNKNEVVTWKNLILIMETPARDTSNFPFKMQKALVSNKMVPCINAKPYLHSELLMTVNDLMDEFFPTVSMHKCKEVLQNVLQVNLYAGNLQQKTVLRDQGKCKSLNEILPLIQLKDVLQYMPQLKYVMLRSSGNDDHQQSQKRQRLS